MVFHTWSLMTWQYKQNWHWRETKDIILNDTPGTVYPNLSKSASRHRSNLNDKTDLRPSPIAPNNPELDLSSPNKVILGMSDNRTFTIRRCSAPNSICLRHSSSILCHQRSNLASFDALNNKNTKNIFQKGEKHLPSLIQDKLAFSKQRSETSSRLWAEDCCKHQYLHNSVTMQSFSSVRWDHQASTATQTLLSLEYCARAQLARILYSFTSSSNNFTDSGAF